MYLRNKPKKIPQTKSETWYSTSVVDGNGQKIICEVGRGKMVLYRRSCNKN